MTLSHVIALKNDRMFELLSLVSVPMRFVVSVSRLIVLNSNLSPNGFTKDGRNRELDLRKYSPQVVLSAVRHEIKRCQRPQQCHGYDAVTQRNLPMPFGKRSCPPGPSLGTIAGPDWLLPPPDLLDHFTHVLTLSFMRRLTAEISSTQRRRSACSRLRISSGDQ
jgi:hypothetical protein